MKNRIALWKEDIIKNKKKIYLSVFFLIMAVMLDYISGTYVDRVSSVVAPDLFLGHFGPMNLTFLFIWVYWFVIAVFFIYPFIFKPGKIHYAIGMFSLFVVIRAGFMILTHLKVPTDAISFIPPGGFGVFFFSNDMFFSGHAGLPFLGFLMFKNKGIKYFMLASSIILGLTVLLMHLHYSIDVASAFFISYGIYKIGNKLF